jgi:hypothetical protein
LELLGDDEDALTLLFTLIEGLSFLVDCFRSLFSLEDWSIFVPKLLLEASGCLFYFWPN